MFPLHRNQSNQLTGFYMKGTLVVKRLNTGILLRCVDCSLPCLMYAQRKASTVELKTLKWLLNNFQYICGTTLQGLIVNWNSLEHKMLEKVFASENISCAANMEAPYYSFGIFPKAFVYCGKSNSLEPDGII